MLILCLSNISTVPPTRSVALWPSIDNRYSIESKSLTIIIIECVCRISRCSHCPRPAGRPRGRLVSLYYSYIYVAAFKKINEQWGTRTNTNSKKKKNFINNNNPSTETPSTYRQTVHKRPRIFDTSKYIIFHYSTLYTKIKLLLSNNYQYLHLVPTTPDGSRQHRSVAELHVHTYKTFPIRI